MALTPAARRFVAQLHREISMRDPGMAARLGGGRAMRGAGWRPTTCQFIAGEPKARDFCGRPVKPGSSYCPEHHAVCWHPPDVDLAGKIRDGEGEDGA